MNGDLMMKKALRQKTVSAHSGAVQDNPHSYFVLLNYPREFRRALLEGSRSTIYTLQRYQKIKLLREEKKKQLVHLRAQIKEISFLLTKLQELLPSHPLPAQPIAMKKKAPVPKSQPKIQHKEPSELDKLSDHLNDIESRLSRL
jgi:hypothetical protein